MSPKCMLMRQFHYEDISKHTNRVKDRILSQAGSLEHTSDWVAHGLIDSIVDAFFPLIRFVDGEVDDIDSLTVDPSVDPKSPSHSLKITEEQVERDSRNDVEGRDGEKHLSLPSSNYNSPPMNGMAEDEEKRQSTNGALSKQLYPPQSGKLSKFKLHHKFKIPHFSSLPTALTSRFQYGQKKSYSNLQPFRIFHYLIYIRLFFLPVSSANKIRRKPPKQKDDRKFMLRRITDTRKLVTGLTRLLGTKNQVVSRLRKRAKEGRNHVEVYIGDVEGMSELPLAPYHQPLKSRRHLDEQDRS